MKEYLIGILGVCLLSAVASVLSTGNATKKHIEILSSLCLVATVASPIATFIGDYDGDFNIFDFETESVMLDYEELYEEYLLEGNARTSEGILEGELSALLGVGTDAFDVELWLCVSEAGMAEVEKVRVRIFSKGIASDPDIIREHILRRTGNECEIIYSLYD